MDSSQHAEQIVAPQKGILAADESSPTIKKRFEPIGVESTDGNAGAGTAKYFSPPKASNVISAASYSMTKRCARTPPMARPSPNCSGTVDILPGIKVDKGAKALALQPGNKVTEGLDGLRDRLAEYKQLGARFAKWRAVIEIDEHDIPSDYAIRANAHALARYAALCQEVDLVPIVEPEVLMDGAHDIDRCEVATSQVLARVFAELDASRGPVRRHAAQAEYGDTRKEVPATGRASPKSPRRQSAACGATSPLRCPASFSSPAGKARRMRPTI